jgi:protein-disulfide isomerase
MKSWLPGACLAGVMLTFALVVPGSAEQTSIEDLKQEIESLKTMIQGIQKDLQEVKGMLARQVPPPTGIGTVIDFGGASVKGEKTAKLTLVEVSDFQCPFCAKYVHETYPQVESEYIKTGKMRAVFMNMPLESIHKFAFKAAQAASCAGAEGKFWEMHDRLFENQRALEPWTPHAEAVGIDVPEFETCLASGKFDTEIRRQMGEARKAGVTGTPAFLIGRTEPKTTQVKILAVLKGAKSFADFKSEVDRLLEEVDKPRAAADPAGSAAPAGAVAPAEIAEAAPKAADPPARANVAADGTLDETTRASLERVLRTAPAGSPAWIAAPKSDAKAVTLAKELSGAFTSAGWRVRPVRQTAVTSRPGTYVFVADEEPPAYVNTIAQALDEAGLTATLLTGYRSYYEEKRKADPKYQGYPLAPEQTFLLVIGRMP